MTPFDRQVRAQVYRHLIASGVGPSALQLAEARGWSGEEVGESLARLEAQHLLVVISVFARLSAANNEADRAMHEQVRVTTNR